MKRGGRLAESEREQDLDLLREASRSFLAKEWSPARARPTLESPRTLDRSLWRAGAALGWTAAAIPATRGGVAIDALDLVVLTAEIGRALYNGPFLGSVLAAAVVSRCGSAGAGELVGELESGDATGAWCFGIAQDHGAERVVARRDRGQWHLDGRARFVVDADLADHVVVAARTEKGGEAVFVVARDAPTVSVAAVPGLDLTRRLCTVIFDGTECGNPIATGDDAAIAAEHGQALGTLLTCADSVGCGDRLLEMTVDYALQRVAFGRTIASYQAIKHKCADMLFWLESSRVTTHEAARSEDVAQLARGASVAKSVAGEACSRLAGESLQIHGGTGFTWEHDLHLYLRRIKANEVLFGDIAWHRHRLAAGLT